MGILGAHVSAAGGIQSSPVRGKEILANSIQIFTANQNQWFPKQPTLEECDLFAIEMKKNNIQFSVSHASYLLNMGSPDEKKLGMSRKAFGDELKRCLDCKIDFIVFHPGAHMKTDEESCIERIAESLDSCLEKFSSMNVGILIENTAGQGSAVGYTFSQLWKIIDKTKRNQALGICFDTQHAFAAGYDIRAEIGWNDTMKRFDDEIGLKWLKAFHINDSKKELGSRVDRHEKLGKGLLTRETFSCLVNDSRFTNHPMILETPVSEWMEYKDELYFLKSLIGK